MGVPVATRAAGVSIVMVEWRDLGTRVQTTRLHTQRRCWSPLDTRCEIEWMPTAFPCRRWVRAAQIGPHTWTAWFLARTYTEPVAWANVMCTRPTTSQAHIIVRAGEELVSIFAFASAIMVSDIRETVHALSTFSADIKSIFADDSGCVWIREPFGISV